MRPLKERVWTPYRRAMGNLLPALPTVLPMAVGVALILKTGVIFGPGLAIAALGPVLGWFCMNLFGLFQNEAMKARLARQLLSEAALKQESLQGSAQPSERPLFVGMARPGYTSVVDPHEDLGFLILHPERVEFRGEKYKISLSREQVSQIARRPNAHTYLGLGGWISLEGVSDGKPVRLQIEPRERSTLRGNVNLSRSLHRRLQAWLDGAPNLTQ